MNKPITQNETVFMVILFLPMMTIGYFGILYDNIGFVFLGVVSGIFCAKMSLVLGVVKP